LKVAYTLNASYFLIYVHYNKLIFKNLFHCTYLNGRSKISHNNIDIPRSRWLKAHERSMRRALDTINFARTLLLTGHRVHDFKRVLAPSKKSGAAGDASESCDSREAEDSNTISRV
jgi:hypothetical protein